MSRSGRSRCPIRARAKLLCLSLFAVLLITACGGHARRTQPPRAPSASGQHVQAAVAPPRATRSCARPGCPVSTAAPVILDPDVAPIEQSVLPASNGSWSGSPTNYSYQWQRCAELDKKCLDIVGATGPRYTLTTADVRHNVQLQVTACNAVGCNSALSNYTPAIAADAPTCTTTLSPANDGGQGLQSAIAAAAPGSVICLNAGRYPTSGDLRDVANDTPTGPVTIQPAPGAVVRFGWLDIGGTGVRNLTFQGISLDRGVSLTGPASHINFYGNIIDGGYDGGPGPSGFFFYGNGANQTDIKVESNHLDHLDGDASNSDGQCMTVAGGDRIEHDFSFSHNVCGPYIQDHYTQYGGIDGLTSDYNTFLGPLPANHTSACGGQTGCHNNTIQIFGSSDDVDFSNNYIWRTDSEAQAILWQEGTFKRMTINNNLIVDDPACFKGASCGEAPSLCQADGLTITNNTFVDQAWASLTVSSEQDSQGICPGTYSKGTTAPAPSGGSDNDISHNIAITPDGAKINGYSYYNLVTVCGTGPCVFDENVSEDSSAAPSSPYTGARAASHWKPAFADGSQASGAAFRAWYQGPSGLGFSAGYRH